CHVLFFFFSSRRRHTRFSRDWSSDVCSSDLELSPDIVTLDLELPDLGGLDTLGYIMSEAPRPVVILSAHGGEGADITLRALDYGAVDFVLKPAGDQRRGVEALRTRLLAALRAAAE